MEIFKLFGSIFVDTTEADEKIEKTGKKSEGLGTKLGNVAKTAGKWALGLGTAAVTAATAIGGMAVNTAKDIDKAVDSYITATGSATESTEEYEKVLGNIYKNNYGEDFQDIANSMAEVKKQIGDVNNSDLQNITENALALRDTFGYDVNESVRAAKMMMDQWGISADEAYNLIAQGAQSGLDKNGDLLDSINEYSVHFQQAGFQAEDMFNVFKTGADNGAFSIDKIGDAVKEMGIRIKDGSSTEALKQLGLDAEEITNKFSQGGDVANDAFIEIAKGLNNVKDPLEQNKIGVQLFGTMWEDLGAEATTAMTLYGDEFNKTLDTMNQIKEVKYDNLSDMFESLKRNVEMLLLPLGNSLMPILEQIIQIISDNMPFIQSLIEQFTPIITALFAQLLPPLMQIMQTIMPPLLNIMQQLIPFFTQILETILPVIIQLINTLLPPILQIVQLILPIFIQLMQPILNLLQPLINLIQPILDLLMIILEPLLQIINMILPPLTDLITILINSALKPLQDAFNNVANVLSRVFKSAFETVMKIVENVKGVFQGIIDFIKNVFTGNWEGAWNAVKDIFKNIADGLGNIFKAPINFIIGLINGFIEGLNHIKIPDWVPGVGGFGINIPKIPKLKVGMDYVPEDDFPAILHKGEAVLTKEENEEYRKNLSNPVQIEKSKNDEELKKLIRQLPELIKDAVKQVSGKVILNEEKIGSFVIDTVAKEVFN